MESWTRWWAILQCMCVLRLINIDWFLESQISESARSLFKRRGVKGPSIWEAWTPNASLFTESTQHTVLKGAFGEIHPNKTFLSWLKTENLSDLSLSSLFEQRRMLELLRFLCFLVCCSNRAGEKESGQKRCWWAPVRSEFLLLCHHCTVDQCRAVLCVQQMSQICNAPRRK